MLKLAFASYTFYKPHLLKGFVLKQNVPSELFHQRDRCSMIRSIVTSPVFLQMPSTNATQNDRAIGEDLKETLQAHAHECVGMAANMIGVSKRIIAVKDTVAHAGKKVLQAPIILMYNPEITQSRNPYEATEGCLSLSSTHSTTRYEHITVCYLDEHFKEQTRQFSGYTAQIIQHEIDHCNGILI